MFRQRRRQLKGLSFNTMIPNILTMLALCAGMTSMRFGLDEKYGFFWCEDTDLSFQSMYLNKINYRINGNNLIEHKWGGSGEKHHDLFIKNWKYLKDKWKNKFLNIR